MSDDLKDPCPCGACHKGRRRRLPRDGSAVAIEDMRQELRKREALKKLTETTEDVGGYEAEDRERRLEVCEHGIKGACPTCDPYVYAREREKP